MSTHQSLKLEGVWDVKRRINIPALNHPSDAAKVESAVADLPGVLGAHADPGTHRVSVGYNASETDYKTIADRLSDLGFAPKNNWWNRAKAGWFHYSDSNARENARTRSSPCCNKPPR